MEIIKHYRDNKILRDSFNRLAESTFGLNFENWYQNGFWGDCYDPYSVVMDGEVVANVSLNRTDMVLHGKKMRIYQLGTVMTAPEYRNRGLIRAIMEEIEKDTADADGMYLFANDSVLDFYPKFGFQKAKEYIHTKRVDQNTPFSAKQVRMDCRENWELLRAAMESSSFSAACRMVDNPGLIFFYVSQFMQDCVYRCEDLDAWVIAKKEGETLTIHEIFADRNITLEDVIHSFGPEVRQVSLGFTPSESDGFTVRELKEEDSTFFIKGDAFTGFEAGSLRIPSLAHA